MLHPFPEGWYFVASRKAVLKAKLIHKTWMGQKIVVWCDGEGRICVAGAVCPHLGASLGPESGGRVRDGCLVCPFHGYEFDASGECVATPYAPPPKATRLKVFQTREVLDIVFAWWGINGRAPQWVLPESPVTGADWSMLKYQTIRFAGHPQETTENAVDLAHLRYVHGYDSVGRTEPLTIDGASLLSAFEFKRTQRVIGLFDVVFNVSVQTHVHGLGYSFVDIWEDSIDMRERLWILATPVDGTLIDMVLVNQVRQMRKPRRMVVGLKFLPPQVRHKVMNKLVSIIQRHDVMQDVIIWERKQYVVQPRLCRSDGEIGRFRRYCRQFYA